MTKQKIRTKMIFNYLGIIAMAGLSVFCNEKSEGNNISVRNTEDIKEERITGDSIVPGENLTENQRKVLEGAKKVLKEKADYDMSMAYYTTQYNEEGEFTGAKVFPGGDIDPSIGVCTDVVVRSLRKGDVVDLQEAIYEDLRQDWSAYPMSRWGSKKPDTNIDHRRVPNLEVWLGKYWDIKDMEDFQPGDVVVWDLNQDGTSDHIGIVSDKVSDGRVYVIHNYPDPGYVAEEDVLDEWMLVGHYRIKD